MASLYSWTKKIWIEPLKLCSYLAYKLSYWFFKVFQKITAICRRHLGFLSDNINAVISPLCSPTIFWRSHWSISVSSMQLDTNTGTINDTDTALTWTRQEHGRGHERGHGRGHGRERGHWRERGHRHGHAQWHEHCIVSHYCWLLL